MLQDFILYTYKFWHIFDIFVCIVSVSCQLLTPSANNQYIDSISGSSSLSSSSISSFNSAGISYNRRSLTEHQQTDSADRDASIFGPLISIHSNSHVDDMKCLYYNRTQCEKYNTGCGETYQVCQSQDGNDRPHLCYALWRNSTEKGVAVEFKGCWLGLSKDCVSTDSLNDKGGGGGNSESHNNRQCVQTNSPNLKFFFCCCSGEMCNKEVKHIPLEPITTSSNCKCIFPFCFIIIFVESCFYYLISNYICIIYSHHGHHLHCIYLYYIYVNTVYLYTCLYTLYAIVYSAEDIFSNLDHHFQVC